MLTTTESCFPNPDVSLLVEDLIFFRPGSSLDNVGRVARASNQTDEPQLDIYDKILKANILEETLSLLVSSYGK
jgi:hypothetical protein